MHVPLLHRRSVRFVERNTTLYALLGLVSFGRRFELAMTRLIEGVEPGDDEEPHRSVYLLLGVLALWRRARDELSTWEPAAAPFAEEPLPTARSFSPPRSLLK